MNSRNARHMMVALSQARYQEIVGKQDNPEILKYFDASGFDGAKLKDETSWCSAFVNWVCIQCDLPRTNKLNARSWLSVGNRTDCPELGDIVVFWRESPSSWKGHVAFYIREDAQFVYCLGGNQGNQVTISAYQKNRVLEYRRIVDAA